MIACHVIFLDFIWTLYPLSDRRCILTGCLVYGVHYIYPTTVSARSAIQLISSFHKKS